MIKVFLVEDEMIMRNGIKNIIPWEEKGFEFVGEAGDGELAFPLIMKTKPDILITDIKMPFMDGLALSTLIKKEMPDIKIIILSGYNDFEYAKEAIRIGVTDYLLKPITANTLLDTVLSVAKKVEEDKKEQELKRKYLQDMHSRVYLEQQKLFYKIITNQVSSKEILEEGEQLGLDFVASYYQVVLLGMAYKGTKDVPSEASSDEMEKIEACFRKKDHVMVFQRGMDELMLLLTGESKEQIAEVLADIEKEVLTRYTNGNAEYFAGLGSVSGRLGEIKDSYRNAGKAFSRRFFLSWNRFVYFEDEIIFDQNENTIFDINTLDTKAVNQKTIISFLKSGALDEVNEFVEEYLQSIGEKNLNSLMVRQYVIMNFIVCIKSFFEDVGIERDQLTPVMEDTDTFIKNIVSKGKGGEYLNMLLSEAIKLRNQHSEKKYNKMINEAKEFIRENFAKEEISLNLVAKKVNMSPSYFSTVFSQEIGKTFVEYMTTVRMERARELLTCSSLKTIDIAYEVGYKDPHYFGYLFKKLTGMTPKEYRQNKGRT